MNVVPQESILRPVLFLIYVNILNSSIHSGTLVHHTDNTTFCIQNIK